MTEKRTARVGPYELVRRIGKGGMASVYLARGNSADGAAHTYAVKVMHPHLAQQPELVDMLMDEARIASSLDHPHIVPTVDLGVDRGRYYMAMEYVEGIALDRLLRSHAEDRPPEVLVSIAIDVLAGLAAAHALRGDDGESLELVHRDVTPGNILVGLDGRARLLDFGVAKARARLTKTMPGIVKGKAGYVAPEVALGRPLDGRADIFSMGVLLWNALTGEHLYDTDDLAKSIKQLVTVQPPAPSTVGFGPPSIFDAAILSALAQDPNGRHTSASEMADALYDALAKHAGGPSPHAVAKWVHTAFGHVFEQRRRLTSPDDVREDATLQFARGQKTQGKGIPAKVMEALAASADPPEESGDEGAATEIADASLLAAEMEAAAQQSERPPAGSPPAPNAPLPVAPTQVVSYLPAPPSGVVETKPPSLARTLLVGVLAGILILLLAGAGLFAFRMVQVGALEPSLSPAAEK
ncbi:MAG: serine/threonine-protein kinase [Sandaracinaceae bacterium]